jgi:hypothetical protein
VDWLAPAEGELFDNRGVVIGKNLPAVQAGLLRELEKCIEG